MAPGWPARAAEEGSGVIRGIAVDEQGVRLPGAGVWLRTADGREPPLRLSNQSKNDQAPRDPAVDFEFTELLPGVYRLEGVSDRVPPIEIELKEGQMLRDDVRVPVCREKDLGWRIWFAARLDRADEVRKLLALGANPNPDEPETSLLSQAAAQAGLDVVRLLVDAGAAVCAPPEPEARAKMREPYPDYVRVNGLTPFENALWRGKTETAQFLLERGAQTNDLILPPPGAVRGSVVDGDGQPLEQFQVDLVRARAPDDPVRKSAWTDAQGVFFFPALEPCAWNIHVPGLASNEFGPVALTADAPTADLPPLRIPRRVLGTQKLLGHALLLLSADEIRSLVADGADVDGAGVGGQRPLMRLAQWGKLDAVRALVEAGAALDAEDDDGCTAMDLAVLVDRTDVVAYLRKIGARPSLLPPPPPGCIGGVLLDEQDRPLPRIPLQCSAGEEAKLLDPLAFTESDGTFRFVRLEPGEYDVRLFSTPGILLTARLTAPDFAVTNAVLRCARAAAADVALALHLQVDSPHVADVLEAGADANRTNALGQTALMIATENGYPKAVQALLDAGANVDATDPEGDTVLHWACQRGDKKIAARLIAAGAKLNATNRAGRTPLDVAVWEGREEVAQQLRELGAPGSVAESKAMGALSGTVRDDAGAPVAHASVVCSLVGGDVDDRHGTMTGRDGRYRIGRLPLGTYEVQLGFGDEDRKTVALNHRDEAVEDVDFRRPAAGAADLKYGQTPLHRAASALPPRNVQILLKAGADVDATNRWGQTALMIAAESGQSGNLDLLLKAGADVGRIDYNGCSALHLACKNGNRNAVKRLVAAGADLAQTNRWGRTPLDEATWENRPEVAEALRAAGAPGTLTGPKPSGTIRGIVVDEEGAPLRNIVFHVQRQAGGTNESGGHVELRTGADGSFRISGETAGCYRFASISRLDDPVVVCLTNDWDAQTDVRVPLSRRCVQEAALHAAVGDDDPEAAERALAEGADPRAIDSDNASLLEMALNQWATNVVPVLLAHGADLNAPNAAGITPLRRAASVWSSWKIPYLLRLGAAVRPEEGGSPLLLLDVVRREPGEDEEMQEFRRLHVKRCAKTARLLIAAGAALDVRDENGLTPLHHAALNGYAECAKVLMNAHVDEGATNAAGQTALDLAVAAGQDEVATVLRRGAPAEPPPAAP